MSDVEGSVAELDVLLDRIAVRVGELRSAPGDASLRDIERLLLADLVTVASMLRDQATFFARSLDALREPDAKESS